MACDLSIAQTVQYLTFSNRIALQRAKLYHKPPESHTIYDKVNPLINVLFLLSAICNKRLILSLKFYEPPSNKCHLTVGVAFIKNIPVTVTFGVKYMKINTCTKIFLSKTRKLMSQKLVPLTYFILYRSSIAFIIHNFWILLILLSFYIFKNFLTPLLLRAPSNQNRLKFQWLNKHPRHYLEDLRYLQKVLVWKSFAQNFNRNFIRPNSNIFGLSLETFVTFSS